MEIVTSSKGSRYVYERETGYISLLPSSLGNVNSDEELVLSYSDKINYLQKHAIIRTGTNTTNNYRMLKKEDITEAIINTHQIILEVTERCNLNCYYCGYGQFYDNHDARHDKDLDFERFTTLYDYLKSLWASVDRKGSSFLRISFYGGEPLCNFQFIHNAVSYVNNNPIKNKRIVYSMTTNAVLLDKYMDFLVKNEFEVLISLDGDKSNDSYRIFKNGNESYDIVISNIDKLYELYPSFFKSNVKFNSVIHDRNSIMNAYDFIFERYQKRPMTNELNVFGISKSKRAEFVKMFHSKSVEFNKMTEAEKEKYESQSPYLNLYTKWVFTNLMNDYSMNILDSLSLDYLNLSLKKRTRHFRQKHVCLFHERYLCLLMVRFIRVKE